MSSKSKSKFNFVPSGGVSGGNIGSLDTIEGILTPEFSRTKSIYEVLFEYYPQLGHDSSTWKLISQANTLFNNREKAEVFLDYSKMFEQCMQWVRISLNENEKSETVKRSFLEKEKEDLLEKMKKTFGRDKRFASFTTIGEFLDYATQNELGHTNNKFDEALRNLMIQLGLAVTSDEVKREMRRVATLAYVTDLGNILRDKYPNRDKEVSPEWDRYMEIYGIVTSREAFAEYEDFLSKIVTDVSEYTQSVGQKTSISLRRDEIILGRIANGKPAYGVDTSKDMPIFGEVNWNIEEYKNPEVLCDMFTTYTEDSRTNQRVIAISYGKFNCQMGIFNNNINPPEIIGVTRIGNDGIKHYFAIASLGNMSFRNDRSLNPGEKRVQLKANKKPANFVDSANNKLYGVMSPKIPEEYADDIVNVLFSDYNMRNSIESNSRCLGYITPSDDGKVNLMTTDLAGFDRLVVDNALRKKGHARIWVSDKTLEQNLTLEQYFGLSVMLERQIQIARAVSNREIPLNEKVVEGDAK